MAHAATMAELRERERHARQVLEDAEKQAGASLRRTAAMEVLTNRAILDALKTAQERAISKNRGERNPGAHLAREYVRRTDGVVELNVGVYKADESTAVRLQDAVGMSDIGIRVGDTYATDPDLHFVTIDHHEGDPPDYFKILQELAILRTLQRDKEVKEIRVRDRQSDEKLDGDQEAVLKFYKAREELHTTIQNLRNDEELDFADVKQRLKASEAAYARTLEKAKGAFERFMKMTSDKMHERTTVEDKEGFSLQDVFGLPEKGWKNYGDAWLSEETKKLVAPYRENAHGHIESTVTGDVVHPPSWWHPVKRLEMNQLLWEMTQDERVLERVGKGEVKGDPFLGHVGRGLLGTAAFTGLSAGYLLRSAWRVLGEPILYYGERWTDGVVNQLAGFGSWTRKYFGFGFGLDHLHPPHERPKPWEERGERLFPVVGNLFFGKPKKPAGGHGGGGHEKKDHH